MVKHLLLSQIEVLKFLEPKKYHLERDIKEILDNYKFQKVDFFRFNGNYGDSLIWHGTINLLKQFGITPEYTKIGSEPRNSILFIDGGGNLVDYYSDVRDFLYSKLMSYEEILILPHTIYGSKQIDLLRRFKTNTTIFCRERVSFKFAKKHSKNSNVYLWHDCAFHCKIDAEYKFKGDGVLNAFRTDCESLNVGRLPSNNFDLSKNGYATKPLDNLLSFIAMHDIVNTDRLHIAIASLLLRKKVNLSANSYFKNKAVYDYSLKKFPNISFVGFRYK